MSIADFARIGARALAANKTAEVLAVIQPGETGCTTCGHVARNGAFLRMVGRRWVRVCPSCERHVEWTGYVDGTQHFARCSLVGREVLTAS